MKKTHWPLPWLWMTILSLASWVFLALSSCFLLPIGISLCQGEPLPLHFLGSGFLCLFLGGGGILIFPNPSIRQLAIHESFCLTLFLWISVACMASLPFYFSGFTQGGWTSAFFEAVSVLTTTGLTTFPPGTSLPASLEAWRFLLQWIGGVGIVLMALTLIPALKIGGRHLVCSEFSGAFEKDAPRTVTMTTSLLMLYVGLTGGVFFLLMAGGLHFSQALCYSISCTSTGGLAVPSAPVATLSFYCRSVLILAMALGGMPFFLILASVKGKKQFIWQDEQIQGYLKGIAFGAAVLWGWGWIHHHGFGLDALVYVVSSLSTTGLPLSIPPNSFVSLWLGILGYLGGCSGSTAGGLKIFRVQLLYRMAKNQILRMVSPQFLFLTLYNGQKVEDTTTTALLTSVMFYLGGWILWTILFSFLNYHPYDALLMSASVLTNSGAGVTQVWQDLSHSGLFERWIIIAGMLCGRLEFTTLIAVLVLPFASRR